MISPAAGLTSTRVATMFCVASSVPWTSVQSPILSFDRSSIPSNTVLASPVVTTFTVCPSTLKLPPFRSIESTGPMAVARTSSFVA